MQKSNGRIRQGNIYSTGSTDTLTNTHAISGMIPIINSSDFADRKGYNLDNSQKQLCRMLNISESDFVNYGIQGDIDG